MFNNKSIIPASYEYLFDDVANKVFTEYLARYVLFDEKPVTTPALWQDVAIYIRYKKRDVWSLSDEQLNCARYAIVIYQVKYITEHLKKPDILQALNQFFTQTPEEYYPLMHFLEKKLHASIDSLLFTQERRARRRSPSDRYYDGRAHEQIKFYRIKEFSHESFV